MVRFYSSGPYFYMSIYEAVHTWFQPNHTLENNNHRDARSSREGGGRKKKDGDAFAVDAVAFINNNVIFVMITCLVALWSHNSPLHLLCNVCLFAPLILNNRFNYLTCSLLHAPPFPALFCIAKLFQRLRSAINFWFETPTTVVISLLPSRPNVGWK